MAPISPCVLRLPLLQLSSAFVLHFCVCPSECLCLLQTYYVIFRWLECILAHLNYLGAQWILYSHLPWSHTLGQFLFNTFMVNEEQWERNSNPVSFVHLSSHRTSVIVFVFWKLLFDKGVPESITWFDNHCLLSILMPSCKGSHIACFSLAPLPPTCCGLNPCILKKVCQHELILSKLWVG